MRVLVWSEGYWPTIGGLEILLSQLNHALRQRGHTLAVIAGQWRPDLLEYEVQDNIPIYRLPFRLQIYQRNLRQQKVTSERVKEIVRQFQPDLHHIHISSSDPTLFFFLRTQPDLFPPALLTLHTWALPPRTANSLIGQGLQRADWVTAVSRAVLAEAHSLSPGLESRSSVIHNGLPWPGLEPTPVTFDPPRLLCLGRLVPEKGFDLALSAFAQMRQKFPLAQLVVAGDGEARPALEALAHDLKLGDSIQFLGWVAPAAVPDLINSVTMVIMPSRWAEPFGLVALQTAQMARPIVATRVGGLPEIVTDSITGRLVPPDSTALAEAVIDLLAAPDQATAMGQAARHRARQEFSMEKCVESYEALYQHLARPSLVRFSVSTS
jgi:glycogen(starch) synthase